VLHLLAIAREANIKLSIDDFDKINRKVPLLADLKPGGRFTASDLYAAGNHVGRQTATRCRHLARRPTDRDRTDDREEAKDAKETSSQQVLGPSRTQSSRPAGW
jgi:dihydroxy-acid dehydratase